MHSTGSILKDIIDRAALYTDRLFEDGKYSEHNIMTLLSSAFEEASIHASKVDRAPLIIRHAFSTVADQQFYTLPPTIQKLHKLIVVNSDGDMVYEWDARSDNHYDGPGYKLEAGRMLRFDPAPEEVLTLQAWFEPSPSFGFHFSDAGGEIVSSTTFNLDTSLNASNDVGAYDRRAEAYVGGVLRILPASGVWEETLITAQNSSNLVTARDAIVTAAGSSIRYEVVPTYLQPMTELVATTLALKLGAAMSMSPSKYQMLQTERAAALKTVRERANLIDGRRGNFWDLNTVYSPEMAFGHVINYAS